MSPPGSLLVGRALGASGTGTAVPDRPTAAGAVPRAPPDDGGVGREGGDDDRDRTSTGVSGTSADMGFLSGTVGAAAARVTEAPRRPQARVMERCDYPPRRVPPVSVLDHAAPEGRDLREVEGHVSVQLVETRDTITDQDRQDRIMFPSLRPRRPRGSQADVRRVARFNSSHLRTSRFHGWSRISSNRPTPRRAT